MTDISKHPLLKACHEACIAIEKLGCGPEQTDAVSRVSDMMRSIEAFVDQLTAERLSHAETKRQLEEADGALIGYRGRSLLGDPETEESYRAYQAALARQASISRPADETPTDDRGEGEK